MEYIKIGNVKIEKTAVLAPMASVADTALRLTCKEFGAALVYSEMVSVKGICYNKERSEYLLKIREKERPFAIQIFGNDPKFFELAMPTVLENKPDLIDINMECPEDVVTLKGAGCALMKNPELAEKIAKTVVLISPVPVTVKIGKGFYENDSNAVSFAKMLQDCGVSAICVHGRTKEQLFRGKSDWDIVKKVKENVSVPVILSGDVTSVELLEKAYKTTNVDLVMIGRQAAKKPWIFKQIKEFKETGKVLKEPTEEEILKIMLKHIKKLFELEGEVLGARKARSAAIRYFGGFKNVAKIRAKCSFISSFDDVLELVSFVKKQIC